MMGRKFRRYKIGGALLAGAILALAAARGAPAQDLVQVVKVVLAEPEIEAGGEQLVQVSLRNNSGGEVRLGLKVEIRLGRKQPTGIGKQRVVTMPPFAERRIFFPLQTPAAPGRYTARLVVLTPDFKRNLLVGNPEFFSPFIVAGEGSLGLALGAGRGGSGSGRTRTSSFPPPRGLKFEKADLLWENFSVEPASVLLGEPLKIKADLRNVGGDIARDISVRLDYVNIRLPTRLVAIATSRVEVLAPGEKIELEFEHPFAEDTLLGEYRILLNADTERRVDESNEKNNRSETRDPIRVSTIRQVFPEPGFVFEEAGLFLFRWESRRYNEFKVQVGTESTFQNRENFFDIPQGEKWTPEMEVAPLAGELPAMLKGLLLREKKETAYWRVVGKIAGTDKQGFSRVRPFSLKITEPAGEPPPAEEPPAAAGASAGPAGSPPR